MARTSDELAAEIQLSGMLPANQELLTVERLLSFATEMMESKVVPTIQAVNQAFFVSTSTSSFQQGQQSFAIPSRAIGRALQGARVVDRANNDQEIEIPLLTLEEATRGNYSPSPTPSALYFMGDRLWSSNKIEGFTTCYLKLYYLERPGRLVPLSSCSRVVGVSTDSMTFTTLIVDQVADGFIPGAVTDIVQGTAGNSSRALDQVITNVAGNSITYDYVTEISTGDYICPQFKSCVLQIPEEGFGYLVALTTEKALKAIGDLDGAGIIAKDIPELKKMFEGMLSPRLASENYRIVNRNGLLRGRRGYGPRFRY